MLYYYFSNSFNNYYNFSFCFIQRKINVNNMPNTQLYDDKTTGLIDNENNEYKENDV